MIEFCQVFNRMFDILLENLFLVIEHSDTSLTKLYSIALAALIA